MNCVPLKNWVSNLWMWPIKTQTKISATAILSPNKAAIPKTDGTVAQAGDLLLSADNLHSRFKDKVELTAEQAKAANLAGIGRLRDLREAANDGGIAFRQPEKFRKGHVMSVHPTLSYLIFHLLKKWFTMNLSKHKKLYGLIINLFAFIIYILLMRFLFFKIKIELWFAINVFVMSISASLIKFISRVFRLDADKHCHNNDNSISIAKILVEILIGVLYGSGGVAIYFLENLI